MTDTIFIGIAGGTGSGKTTLTEHIKKRFGDAVSVIYHDNYYRDQTGMPFEVRCRQNYDHPDAFETDLMVRHLKALKAGVPIQCPVYSYTEHNRTKETITIQPTSVVIVEGLLIFQNPELRDLMDIKILDTDRRAHPPPHPPGREGAGAEHRVGGGAVPHHGQAHARAVH